MEYMKNQAAGASSTATYDEGLRAYMLKVYNYMCMGLALTGAVSFLTASSEVMMKAIFGTPLAFVVMFAPLGIALFFGFKVKTMKASTAQALFWVFATVMGLSLSSIFIMYTGTSIARVFFITAATFGAMSLYGYTTKRDLSGIGSFLFMGLIALIIASVVNIFLGSTVLQFAISVIGVLIFVGLTAVDTQNIKQTYYHIQSDHESVQKYAVVGALSLYMDFINLFIHLLQLLGERR